MLLPYKLDYQDTSYWCGPSSTRAVLLTRGIDVTEPMLAKAENTTTDGTMRFEIVEELTTRLGVEYRDQAVTGSIASAAVRDLMRQRITATIAAGYGTIVNVVGTAYDTAGARHSYTGHYVAVVGADEQAATIMDCAIGKVYQMAWSALADWAAQRGYLYIPNPPTAKVEDDMRFILVRFEDAEDPNKVWLANGMTRRHAKPEWLKPEGSGPMSNAQVFGEGFFGPLLNGGKVYVSKGDPDVWGVEIPDGGHGGGGGLVPHTHETGPAKPTA